MVRNEPDANAILFEPCSVQKAISYQLFFSWPVAVYTMIPLSKSVKDHWAFNKAGGRTNVRPQQPPTVEPLDLIPADQNPSKLIDCLIKHWTFWDEHEAYYLTELAPSLVANPDSGDDTEKAILRDLRSQLNEKEWCDLPRMIAERRAGTLPEFECERLRREALEKERQEAERLAAQKKDEEFRQAQLRKQADAPRNTILQELRSRLQSDFLGADVFFQESFTGLITEQEFEAEKLSFVKAWITANTPSSKDGSKQSLDLDDEQVAAIASLHGHIQVVARAGSGKTTTLVNRALFLLKHCRIAPGEILILAFNKKATVEIRRRLLGLIDDGAEAAIDCRIRDAWKNKGIDMAKIEASAVDSIAARLNITLPHVMTFHALAYAIVHPEKSILHDGPEGEPQELSRVFQQVIDDRRQNPAFQEKIRKLMLAHFRENFERSYDQSKEELLRFRRSLTGESIRGEYVKSFGEKAIANFLFEHGIAYKYEHNHWWSGINYRPDFTILKTQKRGVIIEYFGLKGDRDYDEMSDRKRAYWRGKPDWTLIEFFPADIASNGVDSFRDLLKKRIEDEGIRCVRLSEDEIWDLVSDRAIDRFTKASSDFISKCRKQSLSPPQLQELIGSYSPLSSVEAMFLDLAHQLYISYLDGVRATGKDDFDGLMQRAAETINEGVTGFQRKSGNGDLASLRYVCIDEFQDFSDLFYRLLVAIRKRNPTVELFCVGDDWQAINGFAGSDLRFFENFEDHIGKSRRLYISTNYRSSNSIVAIGNALMKGLGKPAFAHKQTSGKVLVSDLDKFEPSLIEKKRHGYDKITPAVVRLANKAVKAGKDVVMLCRKNTLPKNQDQAGGDGRGLDRYLDLVHSFFPKDLKERISKSTVHKYKGLEKSMVIVLDAVARRYPLIHPNWVFSRILGDSPEKIVEEERRIFYVALTRAVDTLVVVTEEGSKSPFLEELENTKPLTAIKWADYPPVRGLATHLVVIVGNQERRGSAPTIDVKDPLRASGYGYQKQSNFGPVWEKSFPVEGFRIETLKSEVWAKPADGIVIRIFDYTETLVGQYLIDDGNWNCEIEYSADTLRAK